MCLPYLQARTVHNLMMSIRQCLTVMIDMDDFDFINRAISCDRVTTCNAMPEPTRCCGCCIPSRAVNPIGPSLHPPNERWSVSACVSPWNCRSSSKHRLGLAELQQGYVTPERTAQGPGTSASLFATPVTCAQGHHCAQGQHQTESASSDNMRARVLRGAYV